MQSYDSGDPRRGPLRAWLPALVGGLAVLAAAATPQGAVVTGGVQRFMNFYAGVFSLLAMTAAVVSGLLATERLVLRIRHRVLAQGLHRAASLLAVTFLVAHIVVKVLAGLATPAQIVMPGAGPVGLGALASDLMAVVLVTGLLRARFATGLPVWAWRSLHAVAYLSWPIAIWHGLTAGRPAASWVTLGYMMCGGAVALALATRMIVVVRPRVSDGTPSRASVRVDERLRHAADDPAQAPSEARAADVRAETPGATAVRGAVREPDPVVRRREEVR
ncbi:hypothetical protein [Actinomadura rupiterrae]|uniref:hypothetical protein n=1 Tax=Actinomadura rupiterrae TaxID=559627 RepID=UPI0020A29019|nr:hypothetical protein [Actinomadura rupiterrae]MCP2338480.1 hypothetical protein [Actinomadura rupiterrae]